MSQLVKTAPARTVDRNRRHLIIDATLKLIAEEGVRSLSHRRVARAAGVPPSAPYYYFKTIDELLEQAYVEAMSRSEQALDEIHSAVDRGEDLATALALFSEKRARDHLKGRLSQELLAVVADSTRLQELGLQWDLKWRRALERYVDDATASMLVVVLMGLSDRGRYCNPPISIEELTATISRAIDGPPE